MARILKVEIEGTEEELRAAVDALHARVMQLNLAVGSQDAPVLMLLSQRAKSLARLADAVLDEINRERRTNRTLAVRASTMGAFLALVAQSFHAPGADTQARKEAYQRAVAAVHDATHGGAKPSHILVGAQTLAELHATATLGWEYGTYAHGQTRRLLLDEIGEQLREVDKA